MIGTLCVCAFSIAAMLSNGKGLLTVAGLNTDHRSSRTSLVSIFEDHFVSLRRSFLKREPSQRVRLCQHVQRTVLPPVPLPRALVHHVSSPLKLRALVYDILPSATAVFSYAIGSRKLSANEQFFVLLVLKQW